MLAQERTRERGRRDVIKVLAFPADIGRKGGNAYTPARLGFANDTYTPANELAEAQHGGARMEPDGYA